MTNPRDSRQARPSAVTTVLLGSAVAVLLAASVGGAGAGCSTLGDDCLDSECWRAEGAGGNAAGGSLPGGGGTGGTGGTGGNIGGGGTGGTGGGTGGAEPSCDNGVVDPGELCFLDPYETYATERLVALDMVIFDCDGDGDSDVFTADQGSRSISLLTNDGTGVLSSPTHQDNALEPPFFLDAGNLDDDGDTELLAAGSTMAFGLTFLLFDTTGCALTNPVARPGLSYAVQDTIAFQFDGDQVDDPLALVDSSPPGIRFVDTNQGTSVATTGASADNPRGLSMGELTGDDLPDLVYVDSANNEVIVRRNLGTGLATGSAYATGTYPTATAMGDVDGDQQLDVVVANGTDSSIRVFANNGVGGLSQLGGDLLLVESAVIPAQFPVSVALADIDADGDLDVLTANGFSSIGTSSVSVFLNDGSGAFVHATQANAPGVESDSPLAIDRTPAHLEVVDMNGDGALDIVTSSSHDNGSTSLVTVRLQRP